MQIVLGDLVVDVFTKEDGTKSGAVSVPTTEAQARAYCDSLGAGWNYEAMLV